MSGWISYDPSDNIPIEILYELDITPDDVRAIGGEDFSYWVTLLFAVNEIFVLTKQVIMNGLSKDKYPEVTSFVVMQHFIFIRQASAKVVEFVNLVEKRVDFWKKKDKSLLHHFADEVDELASIKSEKYLRITNRMRDKIIFHFDANQVQKQFSLDNNKSTRKMYLSDQIGNSFYPIAEDVVFVAFLEHFLKEEKLRYDKDDLLEFLDGWVDWNIRTQHWASNFA